MTTELVAEYELIRPDGSLTTTRYVSIPDDVPDGEVRDWVADHIIPFAEEGGYEEWVQRILPRNDSVRRSIQRADEVRKAWKSKEHG